MENQKSRNKLWYSLALVTLVAGYILGWQLPFSSKKTDGIDIDDQKVVRAGGFKYINPLLDIEGSEDMFTELKPFKREIQNFVDQIKSEGEVKNVSIYFRDMNNGPWYGVNERENFSPASLLKLPLMIAYFKQSESEPGLLDKKFIFHNDPNALNVEQLIVPAQTLEEGKEYTVEDLLTRMIIYSDNKSQHLLVEHVDLENLSRVYSDFGLTFPGPNAPESQVTVKQYAGFFRVLFNASYLSKQNSEKAMSILVASEYRDGLVKRLPEDLPVAHKFGEREVMGQSSRQLHDCGIIYYPSHPYLLCVMTRGENSQAMAKAIQDISALMYENIDKQFHKN